MSLTVQREENSYENYNLDGTVKQVKTNDETGKSIFAGDLNLMEDPIEQKRKEAQKKALKIVQDAWANAQAIDESVQKRKTHYEEMKKLRGEAQEQVNTIKKSKEELKEIYGIADDSEEQKDLELLEKRQDFQNGFINERLTDEELERLKKIDANPLTEYQQRALEYNDASAKFRKDVEEAKRGMADDAGDIRSIMIERLKSHPMVDARKSADAIMEAAGKEIVGMLMEEAKEKLDEKAQEEEEKAEEKKEEIEEQEEQVESLREKIASQEAMIAGTKEAVEEAKREVENNNEPEIDMEGMIDIAKVYKQSGDVQQSLGDIKDSMKLLEADLKGIKVDEQV